MFQKYAVFIKITCLLVISLLSAYAGHWVTDNRWQSRWDAHALADAQANEKAATEALTKQQKLLQELDSVYESKKHLQAKMQSDYDQLVAANDSLRSTIKVSTSKLQNAGATIAELRRTNATSELVRRELLGYCLGRVESLATAFDRSRAAGLTCQNAYSAVRAIN